jgi:hypothetical protein
MLSNFGAAGALLATLGAWVLLATPAWAEQYQLGCAKPPFPVKTSKRSIDGTCGNSGDTKTGPKGVQNRVKNNLCRTGPTTTLTFADFKSLQEAVAAKQITFGASFSNGQRTEHFPSNRNQLSAKSLGTRVGEGAVVRVVGLMADPHYSDVGEGEDVNCHRPTEAENDIHINLVEAPAPPRPAQHDPDHAQKLAAFHSALCTGIVVEVIPHFRPAAYEMAVLGPIADKHVPVRISGQLFFDASHHPCRNGTPGHGDPARMSLWEIHPVYAIEVCKNDRLDRCPAQDDSVWSLVRQ